jgi:hypothetical protein
LRFNVLFLILLIIVLGCASAPAWADSVAIQNASFEMTNALNITCGPGCTYNLGPIPGWIITPAGPADLITHLNQLGSFQPSAAQYNLALLDGTTVAFSNGGTISQTLTTALTPNTTYVLSVDVGHRLDGYPADYSLGLYVGNTLLDSISGTNSAITAGTFADESLSFTSGESVPLGELRIVLYSGGPQTDFDDVTLTATATPEPASFSLLVLGLGLMILAFRRH